MRYRTTGHVVAVAVPFALAASTLADIEVTARVSAPGENDGGAFMLTLPRDSGDRGFPIDWDFFSSDIGQLNTTVVWEGDPDDAPNQYLGTNFRYHNQSDRTFSVRFLARVDVLAFDPGMTLSSDLSLRVEDTDMDGSAEINPLGTRGGDPYALATIGVSDLGEIGLPDLVLEDPALATPAGAAIGVDTPLENLIVVDQIAAPSSGEWNTLVLQAFFTVSPGDTAFLNFRLDVLVPAPQPAALFGLAFAAAARRRR